MRSKSITLSSALALFGRIGGSVATLLTTVLLARILRPADFSAYAVAFTLVQFISQLGTLGAPDAAVRFVGASVGEGKRHMAESAARQCLWIGAGGLFLLSLVYFAFEHRFTSALSTSSLSRLDEALIAIWIFAFGLLLLLGSVLRAYDRIGLGTMAEVTLYRIGLLVFSAILLCFGVRSLTGAIAASAGVAGGAALFSLAATFREMRAHRSDASFRPSRIAIASVLAVGLPLLGTALLYRIMTDGSLWIVGYYCNVDTVARYGAAYRMWIIFCLPQMAVSAAIQGRIPALHAVDDRPGLNALMRSAATMAFWPTLAGTLVVCAVGHQLLGLMYGRFYAGGGGVLAVLCVAQVICIAVGSSEYLMAMTGGQMTVLYSALISAVFGVLSGWILTPRFGAMGSAVSAGLSTILFRVILSWVGWRKLGVKTWIEWKNPFKLRVPAMAVPMVDAWKGRATATASMVSAGAAIVMQRGMEFREAREARPVATRFAASHSFRQCAPHILIVFLLIATQRIAIPLGSEFQVPLIVPIVLLFSAWGLVTGYLTADPLRVVAYLVTLCVLLCVSLNAIEHRDIGTSSFAYLLVLYAPIMLVARRQTAVVVYRAHQWIMFGFGAFGILQFAVQLVGVGFIDPLAWAPHRFLLETYNTIQPLSYGATLIKSNAGFFLEASHLSKALSIAILIELLYFRRLFFLGVFCVCYGVTFSGTGAVALALGLMVGWRMLPKSWLVALAAGVLAIVVLSSVSGFSDVWMKRASEVGTENTSGSHRFIDPYVRLWDFVTSDDNVTFGNGAGAWNKTYTWGDGRDAFDPPPVKLIYEYGLVGGLTFLAFALFCFIRTGATSPMKVAALAIYLVLTGGLLEPATLFYCYLLVMIFAADPSTHTAPNLATARPRRFPSAARNNAGEPAFSQGT